MKEREFEFQNKVLNKALNRVLNIAKDYTAKEDNEVENTYEEAIKLTQIHIALELRELIDNFKQVEGIANMGILETLVSEDLKHKYNDRVELHSKLVDINNKIAEALEELTVNILGEEQMNSIALEVELENLM